MKKFFLCVILVLVIIASGMIVFSNGLINSESKKIKIVASNFASYDFLRAIIGDVEDIDLKFLIGPGKQTHSFDPTAKDLIDIQNSDLFVYIGGEFENWSGRVLETIDTSKTKVICIADYVDKLKEEDVDGAEQEEEEEIEGSFNEHIWTSPSNAIKMVQALKEAIIELDPENSEEYSKNAEEYIEEINDVKAKIQEIVDKRARNRLVFGDKMPMQYFITEFNLDVSSAFNGCSTDTEPSSSTIAYLVKRIREDNIPVVLYCELNNGRVAKIIAGEADENVQTMQIQTLHNVSKDDFAHGETWVSLMTRNLDVLKKALD